jgi:hypothetical protein
MEQQRINELIAKYNEGLVDPTEVRELERLIEEGEVSLTALKNLNLLDQNIANMIDPTPSMELDNKFYAMLKEEKRKTSENFFNFKLPSLNLLMPRLAFGVVLLIAGFTGGYLINKPA